MTPTTRNELRQAANDVRVWLSLPGAESRYPGANTIANYLTILLNSVTPDADELLEDELAAIKSIVLGAA